MSAGATITVPKYYLVLELWFEGTTCSLLDTWALHA